MKNAMMELNEEFQVNGWGAIPWSVVQVGSDHHPNFVASFEVDGKTYEGESFTKKSAKLVAAESYFSGQHTASELSDEDSKAIKEALELVMKKSDDCVEQSKAFQLEMLVYGFGSKALAKELRGQESYRPTAEAGSLPYPARAGFVRDSSSFKGRADYFAVLTPLGNELVKAMQKAGIRRPY